MVTGRRQAWPAASSPIGSVGENQLEVFASGPNVQRPLPAGLRLSERMAGRGDRNEFAGEGRMRLKFLESARQRDEDAWISFTVVNRTGGGTKRLHKHAK